MFSKASKRLYVRTPKSCRAFTWGPTFPTPLPFFPGVARKTDLHIESGKGSDIFTTDKQRYLDFSSGIGVLSTGHCHPTVVEYVCEQAAKITHAQQSIVVCDATLQLAHELVEKTPPGLDRVFFANSGSEAVEMALRTARQATGKDTVVTFLGGYHGRTSGALAVTTSSASFRGKRASVLPGGTAYAPYPYEYAGVTGEQSLEALDVLLMQQACVSEIAAVIIEPVLGEGGYVPLPTGYMTKLREWCTKHDILLIADEVQCGVGRTGKFWAVDHENVIPDILIAAKGIASGYPLSAIFTTDEIAATQAPNSLGGTYGGNAIACAAARATLKIFEDEDVLRNTIERGAQLTKGLHEISKANGSCMGEIRGPGLMIGAEFVPGLANKEKLGGCNFAAHVAEGCFRRGMLVLPTGHRDTIRLIPPLVVTENEADECLSIFSDAVADTMAKNSG